MATRRPITDRKAFLAFVAALTAICVIPAGTGALVQATTAPVAFEVEAL